MSVDMVALDRALNEALYEAGISLAVADALAAANPAPAANPAVAKVPARYAAAAVTYAAARASGAAPYNLTDIITVNMPNPKRPGTAGYLRYSMWRTGMTVAQYFAALEASPHATQCRGYGPTDMTYNLKRGLISVSPAPRA